MYPQERLGIKFEAFNDARKLGKGLVSVMFVAEEAVKFVGWFPKPNMPV